jgi:hypothetical protein
MNRADSPVKWRGVEGVIWTTFDDSDDWVVCSPVSAEVHLVTAAAHRLWMLACDNEPRSVSDFVSLLAADAGRAVDDELTNATAETLAFMDEAGLLRPVRF